MAERIEEALVYAVRHHRGQCRKGTRIPYIAHLLQVAGLVLEAGGDEDLAIAARLHDAIEDPAPGDAPRVQEEIEGRFGERVLRIVEGCTDADPEEKEAERYVEHLRRAPADVLLVSSADKLHNARAIVQDLCVHGPALWERFTAGRVGSLWYYRALVDVYREAGTTPLLEELDRAVSKMDQIAGIHAEA